MILLQISSIAHVKAGSILQYHMLLNRHHYISMLIYRSHYYNSYYNIILLIPLQEHVILDRCPYNIMLLKVYSNSRYKNMLF